MRTPGIPTWVTGFCVLLGLFCTATGVVGLFDPSGVPEFITGADNLSTAWAGRMAGTGVSLLLAVGLRSAAAYVVALGASVFREVGDALVAGSGTSDGLPLIVVIMVLVIDVVALAFALKAAVGSKGLSD